MMDNQFHADLAASGQPSTSGAKRSNGLWIALWTQGKPFGLSRPDWEILMPMPMPMPMPGHMYAQAAPYRARNIGSCRDKLQRAAWAAQEPATPGQFWCPFTNGVSSELLWLLAPKAVAAHVWRSRRRRIAAWRQSAWVLYLNRLAVPDQPEQQRKFILHPLHPKTVLLGSTNSSSSSCLVSTHFSSGEFP